MDITLECLMKVAIEMEFYRRVVSIVIKNNECDTSERAFERLCKSL